MGYFIDDSEVLNLAPYINIVKTSIESNKFGPLEKDKEAIWAEKFNSMVQDDAPAFSKKPAVFRLNWQYGLAASFALLLATTFYLSKPDIFKGMSDPVAESVLTEQDLLADQNIIE